MPAISTPLQQRRYLTKRDLQQRYNWKTPLSVDRNWQVFKTIPAPTIYQGRRPLWLESILDAHDAAHHFVQPRKRRGHK